MEYAVVGFIAEEVLGNLLKSVQNAMKKINTFETILKSMESTLQSIIPVVEIIKDLNRELDRGDEEIGRLCEQIKEGQKLVSKCSKRNCCSCFKKSSCADELRELDNSLKRFYDFILPLQNTKILIQASAEVKETRVAVKDIKEQEKNILEKVEDTHVDVKDIHQQVKEIHKKVVEEKAGNDQVHQEALQRLKRLASVNPYMPPQPPKITFGLDKPLSDLKKKLFNNEVFVVVLSAPAGCGKTTLAKKLCHEEDVRGKFKEIFFVTVSEEPNLMVIVRNLCLHKAGSDVPEFQSADHAVSYLEHLLNEPILLVLDDVWPQSEFIVQMLKFQIPDYKILVTSTCAFPRFGSTYNLKPLNYEDSMALFLHSAIPPDQSSYFPDDDIRNKIVTACKGNRLALTAVGGSLCGQRAAVWKSAAKKLGEGGSIVELNNALHDNLQRSLEVLDNKVMVKECYMDLGVFPEGQWIPATALIDMWVELYQLDEDGVNSIARLHELDEVNLVNLEEKGKGASEIDGYYNNHFVMQHDLLWQLVHHKSSLEPVERRKRLLMEVSGRKSLNWWMEQKQLSFLARILSITIRDETFSLNWSNIQAPDVEVLVLNIFTKNHMLPELMKKMDKLKALVITCYGPEPAEISNFTLICSLSNLKRIRLEKVSFPSLSLNSVQPNKLQKISLVMCNIGQAFGNTNMQISSTAFSNLTEIIIDSCKDLKSLPVWFCDLVYLKKLIISSCWELSELPKEIGKLFNLEMLNLRFCTQLVKLPGTMVNMSRLSSLDISGCVNIRQLPKQIGGLHNLKQLFMKGCSVTELPPGILNLKDLQNVMCDEGAANLWRPYLQSLTKLRINV